MNNAIFNIPNPVNEPVFEYEYGSEQRELLKDEIKRMSLDVVNVPIIINGESINTSDKKNIVMPHDYKHVLAEYSQGGKKEMKLAIDCALKARKNWSNMPFEHRAAIFLKAAELISTKYRARINAATMLGQSKTCYQAEIDAACELSDFLRFNVSFAESIYRQQPLSSKGIINRMEYRPLEGFVAAISPFNFTAIGANLCSAPAIMGNTVVWKPSGSAVLSNYIVMQIFMEAGLPNGVINFVPCKGSEFSDVVLTDKNLAGIHFTGSTAVFKDIWKTVGNNMDKYISYPRLVGETGGKDFLFAHNSADINQLVANMIRGAYEYQGQKCSALSRAYIPESIWHNVRIRLIDEIEKIKVGDVADFTNFMGAVIDEEAFKRASKYIDNAKKDDDAEFITGGYDKIRGYYIFPTLIRARNIDYITMKDEIFAPILTVYVYEDKDFEKVLKHCNTSSDYALTGAIFAKDREAIAYMERALEDGAGNFYINDKPTGAVVGQQPFGGARASGTNDKAGSVLNLYRWVSPRTIKEVLSPTSTFKYPYMKTFD